MINFFRRIRRKLIHDSQFFKYLKYAIGEIILVVVGILIALQFNNWNEEKKQKEKEIINLIALKNDLENDLNSEFIPAIGKYDELNKYSSTAVKFYFNKENIPKDSLLKCLYESSREWRFSYNKGAYENLLSTGIDLITNDSLRIKISSLYSDGYSELILFDKVVQNFNDNQYSPIVFNLIKFNDYTLSQNNFNELKYSIPISNSIKSLHRKRVLLLDRVKIVKKDAEILIGDIHKELERLGG